MPSKFDNDIVYLEDLEPPSSSQRSEASSVASTASVSKNASAKKDASKTSVKRQLTLLDSFAISQSTSSEPSAKKLKLSSSDTMLSASSSAVSSKGPIGLQKLNSIPFSLKAFQESLTEEQRNLLQLECQTMGKSWLKVLKDEIKKPYFISLKRFLWEEGVRNVDDSARSRVYPSPNNIYTWSNTPLGRVKVVIIGQDPYPGRGQAHGLCFSVPVGVSVPPSLVNIYAEIKAEYPEFQPPKHGNLSAWASNGVLMLNTCLTVRAGNAGSHANKGWEQFTDKVLDVVDRYGGANLPSGLGVGRGVVFMAWGSFAEKRVAKMNKNKHLILTSAHPSPRAAHLGFLGNGHFRAANKWLEKKYGPEAKVDWCRLEDPSCQPQTTVLPTPTATPSSSQ
ncbi:uracil-DNA glycosylase [Dendrothele bispora CBS 962.96]|uniref:Uracil-DNA glycosylase n=1 Tax=Dendrothele bispora (strain CBS 962.96) TaxID=1314807 RepID=A0A4S8MKU4_DENBC|nr:uracil-DNA glycosylase [Dendrothele bispora CBS 962.96]